MCSDRTAEKCDGVYLEIQLCKLEINKNGFIL